MIDQPLVQPVIKSGLIFFNIQTKNGGVVEVSGNAVIFPGFEDLNFAVNSKFLASESWDDDDEPEYYVVTELSTGLSVPESGYPETEEDAVFKAYKKMVALGKDKFNEAVNKATKVPVKK